MVLKIMALMNNDSMMRVKVVTNDNDNAHGIDSYNSGGGDDYGSSDCDVMIVSRSVINSKIPCTAVTKIVLDLLRQK